jgi:tRNA(Arg) A34 adenosine deaminase TadA
MFKKEFMERAIELSIEKMEAGAGGPFGCVIVKDNEVIAEGWNNVTSSNDPTAHAEITAIRDACLKLESFQLTGCEIYTSCEPCPMCLGAIYWSRPDAIYYANSREDAASIGFDDEFLYKEIQKPILERDLNTEQHLRETALHAFELWTQKSDRVNY